MKGDFSWFNYQPHENFTGVLEQQGRVRLDRDGLAAEEISRGLRTLMGRDTFGPGRVAVPTEASQSFRISSASTDGDSVTVTYEPGRAWIDGIPLLSNTAITTQASYLPPPFQSDASPDSIESGVRDAVVLEVWEDSISAFQDTSLLEPALGGVDTTERVKVCHRIRLRRLEPDEDCSTIDLRDDPSTLGRLTVTPEPAIAITGDCPVEAGGGYSGDGHRLMCIEVAAPRGAGPRFVWSRYGGGLVGRGRFDAIANTITITHNQAMIDAASVSGMIVQALAPDGESGCWSVVFEASVSMADGTLAVTDAEGTWPAPAGEHAFFRLWDGVEEIAEFNSATELTDGIRLAFDVPNDENYRVGDRWFFEARTAGSDFDPSSWPQNATPHSIRYHRAPLGILNWSGAAPDTLTTDAIDDCRDSFPPLTDPCPCCTIVVGDGVRSHGDEDSIEAAIERLPSTGGVICLLPGQHQCNAVIRERANITITGCSKNTRVTPRVGQRDVPIFHVIDSECISLLDMEMTSLGGVCILAESTEDESLRQLLIQGNHILACVRAIQVEGGSEVVIAKNRVRMLDKLGAGVSIYLTAEDSRIEDNDIGVVPASVTPRPPDDPDDEEPPEDPNDPCADEETIYGNVGFFIGFVNFIFGFTLTSIVPLPYRALGGIQIGGGAERISILDNRILGGAGNGITLGGSHLPPAPEQPDNGPITQNLSVGRSVLGMQGIVNDPDGNPAPGVTLRLRSPTNVSRTFTTDSTGAFEVPSTGVEGVHTVEPVTTGIGVNEVDILQIINLGAGSLMILQINLNRQSETADPRIGFVYGVRIEDNEITSMGLNGVGIPPALAVLEEETVEPVLPPVVAIPVEFVPNPGFAAASETRFERKRAAAANPALARLGNPLVDLTILNNRIYGNLASPFSAAMRDFATQSGFGGISLGLCETVTIIGNRIESNGRRHIDPVCGIFVLFGEQVEITDNLVRDNGPFINSDVEIVEGQRGGIAGIFTSIGIDDFTLNDSRGTLPAKPALRIHDNVVQQPMGRALTLLTAGPISIVANHLSAERTGPGNLDRLSGSMLMLSLSGIAGLPSGGCQIASNQISLGPQSNAFMAVALAAAEDVGLDANQIDANQAGTLAGNSAVSLNTLIFANTLRATGNRFREPDINSDNAFQVSLLSMSTGMNTTVTNQGDHCIFAFDQGTPPHLVDEGNLEFNNGICEQLRDAAAGAAKNPTLGIAGLNSLDFIGSLEPPTGNGLIYATALDQNLVSLNGYYIDRIDEAAEHKASNAALLTNEISRLEARTSVRTDILQANRTRLATISRDIDSIRAAKDIVATKPEPVSVEDGFVLQGRVIDANSNGVRLADIQLADARGRGIDQIRSVQTNAKGGYVLNISKEIFTELEETLKNGATIIATPQGSDVQSVVSKVFLIEKQAVLVPDIKINLARDARPINPFPIEPLPVLNPVRPILTPGLRPGATSGRISPLLRANRSTRSNR